MANEYQLLLQKLQVKISEAKSISSEIRVLEFAKQFCVNGVQKNLSPVSAKAVLAANSIIGYSQLCQKYDMKFSSAIRLAGGGYRVLSCLHSKKLSQRFQRLKTVTSKPRRGPSELPLEFWIGRGKPLNPYEGDHSSDG